MLGANILSEDDIKNLLGHTFFAETLHHTIRQTAVPPRYAERQIIECLRYLYLTSAHHDKLGGLFLPVEQAIDEIWHYLILQTREYQQLCDRLPGRIFIHHRSLPYEHYHPSASREQLVEESLRWLPLYRQAFGPFDEEALPHWTMVRFLHDEMELSLATIATLGAADAH